MNELKIKALEKLIANEKQRLYPCPERAGRLKNIERWQNQIYSLRPEDSPQPPKPPTVRQQAAADLFAETQRNLKYLPTTKSEIAAFNNLRSLAATEPDKFFQAAAAQTEGIFQRIRDENKIDPAVQASIDAANATVASAKKALNIQ